MDSSDQKFREKGIVKGGIRFLKPADALAEIRESRDRRVGVLGIDGFYLTDEGTQPAMEHSIDLSGVKNDQERWALAEQFLAERLDARLYFEVVLDG